MTNKRFALDTNILIYLEGNDAAKRSISEDLLSFAPVIPSQVVTEFLNVTRRLRNISKLQAMNEAAALFTDCRIAPIQNSTIDLAIKLIQKYDFQLFDSLVVALALEADCEILYTEDMHHGLLVNKKLQMFNINFKKMTTMNFKNLLTVIVVITCFTIVSCTSGDKKKQDTAAITQIETTKANEKSTIKIGTIEWATCNLGAEKQSDCGSFFTWADAQKSCPAGWRLPTKKEVDDLLKICNGGVWGTLDGVEGLWLNESGKEQEGLFLPAGGFKEPSSDSIQYQKTCGPYWTSTNFDDSFAFYLYTFAKGSFTTLGDNHYDKSYKFMARCIKSE
jgi:uncharacterized protein (TIGR02145 family)